jgi:hypothetical protein
MLQMAGRMTILTHRYAEMEVNRQKLEENVEDARRQLEECLAAG